MTFMPLHWSDVMASVALVASGLDAIDAANRAESCNRVAGHRELQHGQSRPQNPTSGGSSGGDDGDSADSSVDAFEV